jgi:thioredoxin 1
VTATSTKNPTTDPVLGALFQGSGLTPQSFDQTVLVQDDQLKVVYFWGDDCPNCVIAKDQMKEMIHELKALPATFLSVDAYEHRDLATRFGLFGIPVYFLFKNGKTIGRITSFPGRRELLETIRKFV